jgi:uncharacterized membrane protein
MGEQSSILNNSIYVTEKELRKWKAFSANQKTATWVTTTISSIDFSNFGEVAKHDKLVALVDHMLELQKKYHDARMEQDKELYERQIKIVDAQIDKMVYGLYGLTDEEIGIIEESLQIAWLLM